MASWLPPVLFALERPCCQPWCCAPQPILQGAARPRCSLAFKFRTFCRISWPIPPPCPGPSGWQPCPQAHQLVPLFGVICKPNDGALHCLIPGQVPAVLPLSPATRQRRPINQPPLSPTNHPDGFLPIWLFSIQTVVGDSVIFAKFKVNDIPCSPLIHRASLLPKATGLAWHVWPLVNPHWLLPATFFSKCAPSWCRGRETHPD